MSLFFRGAQICVTVLFFHRVLPGTCGYPRMLRTVGVVLLCFQVLYLFHPDCYYLSSNAAPLLSGVILLTEALLTMLLLRLLTGGRYARILLFYSMTQLIYVAAYLTVFALFALFTGASVGALIASQWNDFFIKFIAVALQIGLLLMVSEVVARYVRQQPTEMNFGQFAPVPAAQVVSIATLVLFARGGVNFGKLLAALSVLILVSAAADLSLLSAFRAYVRSSRLQQSLKEMEALQQLQKSYYLSMDEQLRRAQRMRHDYRNTLQTIDALLAGGDGEKARKFAEECHSTLEPGGITVYTGHEILDAVLNNKAAEARNGGIAFAVSLTVPKPLSIPDTDLMSIFSNLLDNALEYERTLPPDKPREIRVEGNLRAGLWALNFQNTYEGDALPTFITTKPDKGSHGFGREIVRSIVEKYDGTLDAKAEGGCLQIWITLNIAGYANGT